jgi:hypothetical protein
VDSFLAWDGLPNKQFPLIFHGIHGKDQREGNSPSWFNIDEATLVRQYIVKLQEYRRYRITMPEIGTIVDKRCINICIGVVTPYRKQVEKIRSLLAGRGLDGVQVGSVEEFQGQEKKVIIVSTVRSNDQFVQFDCEHNLGFVKNPKRFNVAITRAMVCINYNPFNQQRLY